MNCVDDYNHRECYFINYVLFVLFDKYIKNQILILHSFSLFYDNRYKVVTGRCTQTYFAANGRCSHPQPEDLLPSVAHPGPLAGGHLQRTKKRSRASSERFLFFVIRLGFELNTVY